VIGDALVSVTRGPAATVLRDAKLENEMLTAVRSALEQLVWETSKTSWFASTPS